MFRRAHAAAETLRPPRHTDPLVKAEEIWIPPGLESRSGSLRIIFDELKCSETHTLGAQDQIEILRSL